MDWSGITHGAPFFVATDSRVLRARALVFENRPLSRSSEGGSVPLKDGQFFCSVIAAAAEKFTTLASVQRIPWIPAFANDSATTPPLNGGRW